MKRIAAFFLIGLLSIVMCFSVYAEEFPVTVFIDNNQINFDVEPIIENGRTLVPMRYIFEALNASVEWISETSTAVAVKDDIKIEITIGSNHMLKNGEVVELDVPAKLIDGRTLVPVRAVSEGLMAKVEWDGTLRKVSITSATEKKDAYDAIGELHPDDLKILLDSRYNFRYQFEQSYLPETVFMIEDDIKSCIDKQDPVLLTAIAEEWNYSLFSLIINIQIESEHTYQLDFLEDESSLEESIIEGYMSILKQNKLDSANIFSAKYEKTPGGKNVLLISFNDVDTGDNALLILSKYIGIMNDNGKLRYITFELSPFASEMYGKDIYMVCEIAADGRMSHFASETDFKESFLTAIDEVLKR